MKEQTYQLIALDIDGTLLNTNKEITPDTEAAVHRAFAAGKEVVLSTGRSFAELAEILDTFPEMRYGICESGALIFDRQSDTPIAVRSSASAGWNSWRIFRSPTSSPCSSATPSKCPMGRTTA